MKNQVTRNQDGPRYFSEALKKEIIHVFKTSGRSKASIWREYFGEDDDHGGGVTTNRFPSGFLSSGLLGTFFGPLADKFGRKRASLMYFMPLP
jgi:hypothetical protein